MIHVKIYDYVLHLILDLRGNSRSRPSADELHGGQPDEVPVDPGHGAAEEEAEESEEGDVSPEEEKKKKKRIQNKEV